MSFMGFGRKAFGRKGLADPQPQGLERIFGNRETPSGGSPFDRHFAEAERLASSTRYPSPVSKCYEATEFLSAEERGELLIDVVERFGQLDGPRHDSSMHEQVAYGTHDAIWRRDIAVRKEHLGSLLTLLVRHKSFRESAWSATKFDKLFKLIDSAITQGAYLSSGDCAALAEMATAIRNSRHSHSKADTKKMIARAERLEKLAGVTVSATEFLMQRCEGADNPWAIAPGERPNAQFWADLLAETTAALEKIRAGTKSSNKPGWMRDPAIFAREWPAVGEVVPRFGAWDDDGKPFAYLRQHNGKRSGFADCEAYRRLPHTIALARAHSLYLWKGDQIPGLEVLADLEQPEWTALVEHLITQRRATRATSTWAKEALALCQPLGLETVEARLHQWLALFDSPVLDMAVYTDVCNGERFAVAIDRLEEKHPDWPARFAEETAALARAVAMTVASEPVGHGLCGALAPRLIRCDDHVYKNTRVTEGVLGLDKPPYKRADGYSSYEAVGSWMRVSVENEEFLRGAVWLVALMPDRARAIEALADVAQTAATYMWTGDDGMRSKIVANAAIATLIALGGSDIDRAVLRLSKTINNATINPPLFRHLNAGA